MISYNGQILNGTSVKRNISSNFIRWPKKKLKVDGIQNVNIIIIIITIKIDKIPTTQIAINQHGG